MQLSKAKFPFLGKKSKLLKSYRMLFSVELFNEYGKHSNYYYDNLMDTLVKSERWDLYIHHY